jgi:hypothetical protein
MADDITSDDYNRAVFGFIADLRGGVPEKCDFCDQPYVEGHRWPIPEEAGEWTCNLCLEKWGGQE